jgi:hypothetical protein
MIQSTALACFWPAESARAAITQRQSRLGLNRGARGLTGLFGSPLLGHEQAVSMQMPSAGGEWLDGMSVPRGSQRGPCTPAIAKTARTIFP